MAKAISTRSATKHYLLGHCGPLKMNQLPLQIDIIRFQYYLKGSTNSPPEVFFDEIIDTLRDIWDRSSIPHEIKGDKVSVRKRLRQLFLHKDFLNIDKAKTRLLADAERKPEGY